MAKKLGGFDSLFQDKPKEKETLQKDNSTKENEILEEELSIVRTFRIKKTTAQALKISAAKHNLKMGETIDAAVKLYFETHPELK